MNRCEEKDRRESRNTKIIFGLLFGVWTPLIGYLILIGFPFEVMWVWFIGAAFGLVTWTQNSISNTPTIGDIYSDAYVSVIKEQQNKPKS